MGPVGEHSDVMLNGPAVKLPSKYLCLCTSISAAFNFNQRRVFFLLQRLIVKIEAHNY